jgi:hypothetical protein
LVTQRPLAESAARFGDQNRFHTTSHFRNVRALVHQANVRLEMHSDPTSGPHFCRPYLRTRNFTVD